MLTVDHVRARRRAGELSLSKLSPKLRQEALCYAAEYLKAAVQNVGRTRSELEEAWDSVPIAGRDAKLAAGLRKLVDDLCEFETEFNIPPTDLREAVFTLASQRRSAKTGFDRDAVIREAAQQLDASPERIEQNLYADLRDAHRLLKINRITPEALLHHYELGQAQAVLLRARKVTVRVVDARAAAHRDLFRAIKFRRLLAEIHPDGPGYRIELDGPLSLFSSSTKYGLALALLLPAIRAMDQWSIEAEVLWGKKRELVRFKQAGSGHGEQRALPPPEEVQRLIERWPKLTTPFVASAQTQLLQVPGVGVIAPDLAFVHRETGEVVYLELLGYWSRDAVWRRLEMVEAGLKEKLIFACSSRLRVSETVFGDELPSRLLVFKGSLSAKAVQDKLNELTNG